MSQIQGKSGREERGWWQQSKQVEKIWNLNLYHHMLFTPFYATRGAFGPGNI